ncbi:hypothetical protein M9H77_28387 [Catharanthus roseus]|uniref:Uncharacterized protein n=1 Tax=Catharanthus roseus TaxID=4058 RepID=A0ACC0AHG4_CATRO|nr:hypothetical protein M9H77_28387 [Catharanthus roseus]
MAWTVSDSGEWIHLKRGVALWRVWPNRSMWTPHHALWWDDRLVESQEGLETKVCPMADLVGASRICSLFFPVIWEERFPTIALHVLLNSGVEAALMCLDSLRNPHVGEQVPRLL